MIRRWVWTVRVLLVLAVMWIYVLALGVLFAVLKAGAAAYAEGQDFAQFGIKITADMWRKRPR